MIEYVLIVFMNGTVTPVSPDPYYPLSKEQCEWAKEKTERLAPPGRKDKTDGVTIPPYSLQCMPLEQWKKWT